MAHFKTTGWRAKLHTQKSEEFSFTLFTLYHMKENSRYEFLTEAHSVCTLAHID